MRVKLDFRINFSCRRTRMNEKGECPITLRVTYQKDRKEFYTGLYCKPEEWDATAERVSKKAKKSNAINIHLDEILHGVRNDFENLRHKGIPFTVEDLGYKIKGRNEKPALLVEFLKERDKELKEKSGVTIGKLTYEKYNRICRFVLDFIIFKYKERKFPVYRVDREFVEQFFQYLRAHREIGNDTSVKYVQTLRTLLMPAMRSGVIRENPFMNSGLRVKTVKREYLSDEDITKLSEIELSSFDLTRIRDQFLFCCYTGLAYTDLKYLKPEDILFHDEGQYFIRKTRQKTKEESIVPLLPSAIRILKKYSATKDSFDFYWKVSSNQKMNYRLKEIGQLAGISKPLHMHLARHTFATTVTLSKGIPIESVSRMLGHSSLRQTQHYAQIVSSKLIEDMKKANEFYK